MAFSFRKLGKRFFIIANLVVCLLFLLACLQPWLNPETFWMIGFLSLAFPYLLIVLMVFAVFWLFTSVKYTLISILSIMLAAKQINTLFAWNKQESFKTGKAEATLRVFSWNAKAFTGVANSSPQAKAKVIANMFQVVKDYNPDVICFQEYGQYDLPISLNRNHILTMQKMGYPHHVEAKDYIRVSKWFPYFSGLAIFSKTPFSKTERIPFTSNSESILYADVPWGSDTIRVFNTHLQSFKFSGKEYRDIEIIKNSEDSLYEASLNIFSKMKRAFRNRGAQADQIRPLLDNCPYPEIICCDMNDVPSSYAYWQLRGHRKDAFLEKGFGIGRSFVSIAPTLRIDYILPDERFEVAQFKTINKRYSDHLPLVVDLKLK